MKSMVIKSEFGIYKVLEKLLRATGDKPLTCVDLFESNDVRRFAKDANKVSDYLGHMWRRGLLNRFYAPKTSTSFARYAYTWKEPDQDSTVTVPVQPPRRGTARPGIEVSEEDGVVTISFPEFTVTVRPKT